MLPENVILFEQSILTMKTDSHPVRSHTERQSTHKLEIFHYRETFEQTYVVFWINECKGLFKQEQTQEFRV